MRPHRALYASIAALIAVAAASCSGQVNLGGGASDGGGGSQSSTGAGISWPSYCDARAAACGISADKCKAEETCARNVLRDAIETSLLTCLETTCQEDTCLAQTTSIPLSAAGMQFAQSCQAYLIQCPGVPDDICGSPSYVADATLTSLMTCFSMPGCAT